MRSSAVSRSRPWHRRALEGYVASVDRGEVQFLHHLAGYYADSRATAQAR